MSRGAHGTFARVDVAGLTWSRLGTAGPGAGRCLDRTSALTGCDACEVGDIVRPAGARRGACWVTLWAQPQTNDAAAVGARLAFFPDIILQTVIQARLKATGRSGK